MKLRKFLEYFDFDYCYEGDEIALIDQTGANLGDIESERFPKDDLLSIVDRLDIYYKDYIFDDLAEKYGVDPGDWHTIYKKAIQKNEPSIEYLDIIMGNSKLTITEIIRDILWNTWDMKTRSYKNIKLPNYIVVPEDSCVNEALNNISKKTGCDYAYYRIGMRFIDCFRLIGKCVEADLIKHKMTEYGDYIFVYRAAGTTNPEGWYLISPEDAAHELFNNEQGQIELINALNKNDIGD